MVNWQLLLFPAESTTVYVIRDTPLGNEDPGPFPEREGVKEVSQLSVPDGSVQVAIAVQSPGAVFSEIELGHTIVGS